MSTIIFTAYDLNQASKKKPYLNLWSNPSWSQPIYDPEHNNIPRSLTRKDVWKRIYSLEDFGCPKVEKLMGMDEGFTCGRHKKPTHHCPKQETYLFYRWMQSQL